MIEDGANGVRIVNTRNLRLNISLKLHKKKRLETLTNKK